MAVKCPKCQAENPETVKFCGECGTQIPPPKAAPPEVTETRQTPISKLATGSIFAGRYHVIEELGQGGVGGVYRVEDKEVRQEIALKLLRPEIATNRKIIERFRRELKTARMISHRNVCRMFDLGEDKGTYFITMEYVAGEDLKSIINRMGVLMAGKAISISRQVAEGLGQAHKLGIIHRDLKPHNIKIDKAGNAKIMDFGIARALLAEEVTEEGVLVGRPEGYMSPEQVRGKAADARSDLYALGVILFEMVTGRMPYEGDTPLSSALNQIYEAAPDPQKLAPQIPAGLSRIILRCLEKMQEKRYQTAEELLADLEAV